MLQAEEVIPMEQFSEPGSSSARTLAPRMSRKEFASFVLGHSKAIEEEPLLSSACGTVYVSEGEEESPRLSRGECKEREYPGPHTVTHPSQGLKGGSKKRIQCTPAASHETSIVVLAEESKDMPTAVSHPSMSFVQGQAWAKENPIMSSKKALIQAKLIQAMAKFKNKKAELDFGRLTKAEERATGGIRFSVYKGYAKAAGGWPFFLGLVLCHLLGEAAKVGSSFWLTAWTNNSYEQTVTFYMAIFFGFSVLQTFLFGGATVAGAQGSVRASRHLHESMLRRVFRTTMGWLASTPGKCVIELV